MMKRLARFWAGLICLCLLSSLLSGCGRKGGEGEMADDGVTRIYASFYPLYALTQLITEGVDGVELNCLVQPQDGCLRSYELSNWDLALLGSADVVIAGGRGLESFESVLYALGEQGPAVSAVLYNMELKQQPAINTQADTASHWLDPNPHIYMSIDGAINILQRIASSLAIIDPAHEAEYERNLEAAQNQLEMLDTELKNSLSFASGRKVIVINEALVYTAQQYGLEIDLCFDRESGAGLAGKELEDCLELLDGSESTIILIEKQAPQAFCEALEAAGYHLARLDVLSTRRANEGSQGYFEAQRANAQALIEAFG